jgi:ribosomal protein S18 acetylase RimI-like enzyme
LDVAESARLREAGPADEPLLFALFAEDRAAQLALAGLGAGQARTLIEMQYRGRAMTYAAHCPEAVDLILLGGDGTPVGRLLLDRNSTRWRIIDIAVLAAHRGRGIGTEALRECQRQAAAAGVGLELQVEPLNPAHRLYRRLGFSEAGEKNAVTVEMVWSKASGMKQAR